jgi:hypothetical protein
MAFSETYRNQVALLIRILPLVETQGIDMRVGMGNAGVTLGEYAVRQGVPLWDVWCLLPLGIGNWVGSCWTLGRMYVYKVERAWIRS